MRLLVLALLLVGCSRDNRYTCGSFPTPKGLGLIIYKHGQRVTRVIPCVDLPPEFRGCDCQGNYSMMPTWARPRLADPLEQDWGWYLEEYNTNPTPQWRKVYEVQRGGLYMSNDADRIQNPKVKAFFLRCREAAKEHHE